MNGITMTHTQINVKSSIFKSLTFAGLLLGTSLSPIIGHTAQDLSQQGQWKISQFAGNNPEKDSYCALIQPYSDNIYLSLGRNVLGEYSIALDFKTDSLDTNKSYNIMLQPAPGQVRAYDLMPATPRALVVRLGYDDSFFKAFEASKVLKVDINDENMPLPFLILHRRNQN